MKFNLTLLLIFSLFLISYSESPIETAKFLEENGDYYNAITEYKRAFFFKKDPDLLIKIGMLERKENNYKESISYFNQALEIIEDKDSKTKIKLYIVSNYIIIGNYLASEMILEKFSDNEIKGYEKLITLDKILIYISTDREIQALRLIQKLNIKKDIRKFSRQIIALHNQKIDPNNAKGLSTIIPGMGQFASGDIKNGLNAFLLNGAIFYLWYHLFTEKNYIDLVFYFLNLKRYYLGQREKAASIAEKHNEKIMKEIFLHFLPSLFTRGCGST